MRAIEYFVRKTQIYTYMIPVGAAMPAIGIFARKRAPTKIGAISIKSTLE